MTRVIYLSLSSGFCHVNFWELNKSFLPISISRLIIKYKDKIVLYKSIVKLLSILNRGIRLNSSQKRNLKIIMQKTLALIISYLN